MTNKNIYIARSYSNAFTYFWRASLPTYTLSHFFWYLLLLFVGWSYFLLHELMLQLLWFCDVGLSERESGLVSADF